MKYGCQFLFEIRISVRTWGGKFLFKCNDLFEFKMYATNKSNRPFEVVHHSQFVEGALKLHHQLDLLTLDLSIQLVILSCLLRKWRTQAIKAVPSGQSRHQNIWEVVYGSILVKAAVLLSNDNKSVDSPLAGECTTFSDCLLLGTLSFRRPFANSS